MPGLIPLVIAAILLLLHRSAGKRIPVTRFHAGMILTTAGLCLITAPFTLPNVLITLAGMLAALAGLAVGIPEFVKRYAR